MDMLAGRVELGADQPVYELRGNDLRVHFKALESALIDQSKAPKSQSDNPAGALADALAVKIIEAIREEPTISQAEMAERFGVARRSVQRKIEDMKSSGYLERIGGKRYGHWKVNDREMQR